MKIVKYRPKYWMIVLYAVTAVLDGICAGLTIASHEWLPAVVSLVLAVNMGMNILVCLADCYVTTTGMPLNVGPDMKATTLREEA